MKSRNETSVNVNDYIHLRSTYLAFCALAKKELGKGNSSDITFGRVDNVAVDIVALDRNIQMRLGICELGQELRGVIVFERILPREQTRLLLEIFFDSLAHVYEKLEEKNTTHTLKSANIVSKWVVVRLIDA